MKHSVSDQRGVPRRCLKKDPPPHSHWCSVTLLRGALIWAHRVGTQLCERVRAAKWYVTDTWERRLGDVDRDKCGQYSEQVNHNEPKNVCACVLRVCMYNYDRLPCKWREFTWDLRLSEAEALSLSSLSVFYSWSAPKRVNRRETDEAGSAHPSSLHKAQFQLIHSFILKKAHPKAGSSLTHSHRSEAQNRGRGGK